MVDGPNDHRSVLLEEAVSGLVANTDGLYIDGTFGRGGHARAVLARLGEGGRLLAFDKDPEAIEAGRLMEQEDSRLEIVHRSFAEIRAAVCDRGDEGKVDGILLDLGVSSPQLDNAARGFSFMQEGPLDMRMNSAQGMTAEEWLNTAREEEIARVLREYGEERYARRIARAIVEGRQQSALTTTLELAQLIERASPAREKHKHPATRSFQAIRIHVNRELDDLKICLDSVLDVLRVGGRLAVISFHSLEDRLVKRFIQKQVKGDDFPPGMPITWDQLNRRMRVVGKPLRASGSELEGNVRARSAILRIAEKLG